MEIGERSEVGGSGQYLKGRELSEFIDGGVYSGGRIPDSGAVFKDGMNNGVGREHSGKGTWFIEMMENQPYDLYNSIMYTYCKHNDMRRTHFEVWNPHELLITVWTSGALKQV